MKNKFIIAALLVLGSINAQAGQIQELLNQKVSSEQIVADILSVPEQAEGKLQALQAESQSLNLNSEQKNAVLRLELNINKSIFAYNDSVRNEKKYIKIGSTVIGAVIGGFVGASQVKSEGGDFGRAFTTMFRVGFGLFGASVGGTVGYIVGASGHAILGRAEINNVSGLVD